MPAPDTGHTLAPTLLQNTSAHRKSCAVPSRVSTLDWWWVPSKEMRLQVRSRRLPETYGRLGDHLNIGVGGWKHVGRSLRGKLDRLARSYGVDSTDLWGVRGHHLPIRRRGSKLADGNTLLVGDAAGVLDPLTAEGIYGALWTGKVAAANIEDYLDGKESDLDGYREQVERQLVPELTVGSQFHDVLHISPGLFVGIERGTSILWPAIERMLQGESTYATAARDLARVWPLLELLSDSIRVFPPLRWMSGPKNAIPPERFFQRE